MLSGIAPGGGRNLAPRPVPGRATAPKGAGSRIANQITTIRGLRRAVARQPSSKITRNAKNQSRNCSPARFDRGSWFAGPLRDGLAVDSVARGICGNGHYGGIGFWVDRGSRQPPGMPDGRAPEREVFATFEDIRPPPGANAMRPAGGSGLRTLEFESPGAPS